MERQAGAVAVLFWDEPEANLNPHLAVQVVETLVALARAGVQVFVATHDYLVSETLGRISEEKGSPGMAFFSFERPSVEAAVRGHRAASIDELEHNPIRAEFLRHYDRIRGIDEEVP